MADAELFLLQATAMPLFQQRKAGGGGWGGIHFGVPQHSFVTLPALLSSSLCVTGAEKKSLCNVFRVLCLLKFERRAAIRRVSPPPPLAGRGPSGTPRAPFLPAPKPDSRLFGLPAVARSASWKCLAYLGLQETKETAAAAADGWPAAAGRPDIGKEERCGWTAKNKRGYNGHRGRGGCARPRDGADKASHRSTGSKRKEKSTRRRRRGGKKSPTGAACHIRHPLPPFPFGSRRIYTPVVGKERARLIDGAGVVDWLQ